MLRSVAFVILASGCATHVSSVQTSMEPASMAVAQGVTACWVEYSRSGAFTASGIAVRGPEGLVLIDAGQSMDFKQEIREIPEGRFYLKLVPAKLIPKQPASQTLSEAGVVPSEVVAFVGTHAHSDHIGGLMNIPTMPVRMHAAELELLEEVEGGSVVFNVIPAEARHILPHASALTFVEEPYLVFPRHADVLGDGSVVVVPLEGHTPGSVGVVIHAGDVRLLHAGDAVNTRHQVDHLRGKSPLLRPTDADHAAADAQVAVLSGLHDADPTLRLLPAHERKAWVELFGSPGGCIGGS